MQGDRKGDEVICLHFLFPIVFTRRRGYFSLSTAKKNNPRRPLSPTVLCRLSGTRTAVQAYAKAPDEGRHLAKERPAQACGSLKWAARKAGGEDSNFFWKLDFSKAKLGGKVH